MSRVIVVTSGKGGVGKSTCTANLGSALVKLGKKVALVDADFGLRNLDLLLGLENRVVYTAIEAIAGECRLEQALVKDKRQNGLVLLPAAQNRNKESVTPTQMKQLIMRLNKAFDYILVDSPAGIEMGFRNAIAAAREALIVTTPEVAAVRDADRVVGLLEAYGIKRTRLIVNRLKPEMVKQNEMMSVEDVLEILAIPLLGIIPDDKQVIVSSNRGEPLVLGDKQNDLPATAFMNIARRLEGEKVPLLNLMAHQEGFLARIRRIFAS
ncbi:septum site-determining protein MinD [Picosynechococcus sp. PCC 7003]|uniref:septum site-determining protein MinD n=1 Tax=Picosynechococcus sp. PCC 7003 TaxID=374981 RepID=UPI000810B433|nr:septum site-determining protein MinD [Picosynechococcus sp. PCC 7003]ANV83384.1 septum site-determining protein MinD [Picosynechococcus sp. PCC 7003]